MEHLENWFIENRRVFPWRENPTPYRVWISEVMLQQTRASAVIPYFERWMTLFPDVKALYNAPLDRVIKAWEGLGYYSRARNLHKAAKQIVEGFGGEIPDSKEALFSLCGFGPYTVGAILSFAFHKRAAAVDGNVMRVLSRFFCIEENIAKASVRAKLEEKAEALLSFATPWITAEALIELGATICTPNPKCPICPLQQGCLSLKQGKEKSLPIKNEKKKIVDLFRSVFVLECKSHFLVRKGSSGQVMADLYEFPYIEKKSPDFKRKEVAKEAFSLYGSEVSWHCKLTSCSHCFTCYKAHLFPHLFRVDERKEVSGYEWVSIERLSDLPFSSGHRKIVAEIEKIYSQI